MINDIANFEVRRFFKSPGSWLIIAICQFLLSLIFYNLLSTYMSQPALFEGRGITDAVVSSYYRSAGLVFLLVTPLLAMKILSEEIKNGSIKLLLSAPVSAWQILIGKYLAVAIFLTIILFLISLVPLSLSIGTTLDYGHILTCITGVFVLIICLVAISLFFSALFGQQLLAAIISFTVIILLWTAHSAAGPDATAIDRIFQSLSMSNHFTRFTEGLFNSASAIYFFIVTVFFLLLGTWKINAMRTLDW